MSKPDSETATVSFTRNRLVCESLIVLDDLLCLDHVKGEGVADAFMLHDLPEVLLFWLGEMAEGGAFDPETVDWATTPAYVHFMERLWQAKEDYYKEVNGPDWQKP